MPTIERKDNKTVFQKLIEELNFLQSTGIQVVVNNTIMTVKFQLILILGDNLGLNSIVGFIESFKGLNFCRICRLN